MSIQNSSPRWWARSKIVPHQHQRHAMTSMQQKVRIKPFGDSPQQRHWAELRFLPPPFSLSLQGDRAGARRLQRSMCDKKAYICATQKNVFEDAAVCRGLL